VAVGADDRSRDRLHYFAEDLAIGRPAASSLPRRSGSSGATAPRGAAPWPPRSPCRPVPGYAAGSWPVAGRT